MRKDYLSDIQMKSSWILNPSRPKQRTCTEAFDKAVRECTSAFTVAKVIITKETEAAPNQVQRIDVASQTWWIKYKEAKGNSAESGLDTALAEWC